jgi:hypothetical protein
LFDPSLADVDALLGWRKMWAGGEGFLLNCGMKLEHIAGIVFLVVGIAALIYLTLKLLGG